MVGKPFRVKVTVKETREGKLFYDHSMIDGPLESWRAMLMEQRALPPQPGPKGKYQNGKTLQPQRPSRTGRHLVEERVPREVSRHKPF